MAGHSHSTFLYKYTGPKLMAGHSHSTFLYKYTGPKLMAGHSHSTVTLGVYNININVGSLMENVLCQTVAIAVCLYSVLS